MLQVGSGVASPARAAGAVVDQGADSKGEGGWPKFSMPNFKIPETGIDNPFFELPKNTKDLPDYVEKHTPKQVKEMIDKLKGKGDGYADQLQEALENKMKSKFDKFKNIFR